MLASNSSFHTRWSHVAPASACAIVADAVAVAAAGVVAEIAVVAVGVAAAAAAAGPLVQMALPSFGSGPAVP